MHVGIAITTLALLLSALGSPGGALAQQATVRLSTSHEQVRVGQRFRVQLRVDAEGAGIDEITEPNIDSFQIVSRSSSQPIQFSFGFGNRQTTVQQSRVIDYVVAATRPGDFNIGPVTARVGGRNYHSQRVRVSVTGSPSDTQAPAASPSTQSPIGKPPITDNGPHSRTAPTGNLDGAVFDPEAFLRVVVDKTNPIVGEQVTVTVYLYTRSPLAAAPTISQQPNTDGFWTQDLLPSQRTLQPHAQSVHGVSFSVYLLRRFAAFPLRSGDLQIGPMTVRIQSARGFGLLRGGEPLTRVSPSTLVTAADPPEAPGAPSFVGEVSLRSRVDRSVVTTGDAITLTLSAQASAGNIRDLRFALPEIPNMRVLEPRHQDEITHPQDRVGGTRSTEWLLVPLVPGTHEIPAFQLHTFDPASQSWSTASSSPLTITASGPARDTGLSGGSDDIDPNTPTESPSADEATSQITLPTLRRTTSFSRGHSNLSHQPWFAPAFALGPLFLMLAIFGRRLQSKVTAKRNDPARASQRQARQCLEAARAAAVAGDGRRTYAQCSTAVTITLDQKCSEPTGGLPRPDLRRLLLEDGHPIEEVESVLDAMTRWDSARFSPAHGGTSELSAACDECERLMRSIITWINQERDS